MRKIAKGVSFLIVATVFLGLFCGSVHGAGPRFALKISGGLGYLSGGDPNEFLEGRNILRKWQAGYWLIPMEGEYQKIHYGLDFEGSIILLISPRFGIYLGSGSIQGKRSGETNTIKIARPGAAFSESIDTKMSAVPVNLGVYYALPLSERIRLSFNGGLGFYLCRTDIAGTWEVTPAYWDRWKFKATGNGIGFFGGLGLEYSIARHLAIVLEANGRYAKITKLTGDASETDSEGYADSQHGTLSYWEVNTGFGVWYQQIWIWDHQIVDPYYRNWRDAVADFSGFSIRGGIKIYF